MARKVKELGCYIVVLSEDLKSWFGNHWVHYCNSMGGAVHYSRRSPLSLKLQRNRCGVSVSVGEKQNTWSNENSLLGAFVLKIKRIPKRGRRNLSVSMWCMKSRVFKKWYDFVKNTASFASNRSQCFTVWNMTSPGNGVLFVGTAGTASVKIILYMFTVAHGKRRSSAKC